MTEDQKRVSIRAEVTRGDESVDEAQILLAAGRLAGAVSRAYYGAFHYARALLLTIGEEPRSHGGLTRLLQSNFTRSGRLAPETAALLSRLMTFRQDADYTAEFVFTRAMAEQEVENARTFVAAAKSILAADGWLSSP